MKRHKISIILICLAAVLGAVWFKLDRAIKEAENLVYPVITEQPEARKSIKMWGDNKPYIFVTGEYPPFVYSENGKVRGLTADIVKAVLDKMGVAYEIQLHSWSKSEHMMATGEAFGTFPYSKTELRQNQFTFTDCVYQAEDMADYVYVYQKPNRSKRTPNIQSVSDLKQLNVGVVYGYYYIEQITALGIKPEVCQTEKEAFEKLTLGRVDAILLNRTMAAYLMRDLSAAERSAYVKTSVKFKALHEGDYVMLDTMSPKSHEFAKQFNAALKALEADGTVKRLREPYLKQLSQ